MFIESIRIKIVVSHWKIDQMFNLMLMKSILMKLKSFYFLSDQRERLEFELNCHKREIQ